MTKRMRLFAGAAALLGLTAVLLAFPAGIAEGLRQGLTLCAALVIPALFPFLAVCEWITRAGWTARLGKWLTPVTRRLGRFEGPVGGVMVMSLLGGYPVGGRLAAGLVRQGTLTPVEGRRLTCLCVNAGPAFLLSAVGVGLLGSPAAGWLLWGSQATAGLLLIGLSGLRRPRPGKRPLPPLPAPPPAADAFVEGVAAASSGMMGICALVVLFAGLTALLRPVGGAAAPVLTGLLEITVGSRELAAAGLPLPVLAAFLTFGGGCVQAQVLAVSGPARPAAAPFLLTRAVHALLAGACCQIALWLLPGAVPAAALPHGPVTVGWSAAPAASAALMAAAAVLVWDLSERKGAEQNGRSLA